MSGLVRLKRLDLGTRRRGFGEASLVSFKVNPRLRLGLTLNSTRLAFLERGVATCLGILIDFRAVSFEVYLCALASS